MGQLPKRCRLMRVGHRAVVALRHGELEENDGIFGHTVIPAVQ